MKDEDLRGNLPRDTGAILSAIKNQLKGGTSIQEAVETLVNAGMPEGEARGMVNACAGIVLKKCRPCSLSYLDSVASCKRCGHLLEA
jgi:hypothetical protein